MSNIKTGDIVEPTSPRLGLPPGQRAYDRRVSVDYLEAQARRKDAEAREQAEKRAKEQAEREAEAERKAEVIRRIEADKRLAGATLSLLSEIANLNAGLPDRPADSLVAAHATQLDPLARSYGYKVAKAGSIAVVTKA